MAHPDLSAALFACLFIFVSMVLTMRFICDVFNGGIDNRPYRPRRGPLRVPATLRAAPAVFPPGYDREFRVTVDDGRVLQSVFARGDRPVRELQQSIRERLGLLRDAPLWLVWAKYPLFPHFTLSEYRIGGGEINAYIRTAPEPVLRYERDQDELFARLDSGSVTTSEPARWF